MVRKVKAIGISASPERMSERRLRRISGAVSIRCTMSWSVPWVPMVIKVDPKRPAKMVYSIANMAAIFPSRACAGSSPVVKKSEMKPPCVHDFVPTSGNSKIKQPDRDESAAEHD